MGHVSLNIFNSSFNVKLLRIYEPDGKTPFLSFKRFYINFSLPDLIKKVYHIEGLKLEEPTIRIVQHDSTFNFTDILDRFTSGNTGQPGHDEVPDKTEPSGPVKYMVENLSLTNGTLCYSNKDFELEDTIRKLKLAVPLVSYNDPFIDLSFFFNLASGGNFKGNVKFNSDDESMILHDTISDFNLSNYKHYLKPYLDIGSLKGYLHTCNYLAGNASTFDISMTGNLKLTDFAMTDPEGALLAAFKEFSVKFDSVSFSRDVMNLDTVSLTDPVVNFKMTKNGDNFSKLIYDTSQEDTIPDAIEPDTAYKGANPVEMMEEYLQESLNNYLFRNYRINVIQLFHGKIDYDDQTLDEPFHSTLDDLDVKLTNLNTDVDSSYGSLVARLNDDGLLSAKISVNPRDILEMNLNYEIGSLTVPDFNPYSLYYLAHPFPRGTFNYKGSLRISSRKLNSENMIVIEKINVGEKVRNETAVSLPIRLAVILLRNRQGDIRLNIPVNGDLNDPKLKMGRLILDILKNLVIKAATAPYDLLASSFGGKPEDYKELRSDYLSYDLNDKEKRQLENIAAIITEKPELKITFSQVVDRTSELCLAEMYYPAAGMETLELMQQDLVKKRNKSLERYLQVVLQIPPERFSVTTSTDPALINKAYPYFRIKFDINE